MIKVLSIAGSDPSSGAGIQADLKTFQALGAFGMGLPAALTIQNSHGVRGVEAVEPAFFAQQLEALLQDIRPDAVKTGMLLSRQNVEAVVKSVRKFKIRNLVIDPVIRASSGKMLLQPGVLTLLKEKLFPSAVIITPNIPEAELLTRSTIRTERDRDFAAGKLLDTGASHVLIKGGHGRGPAVDTLYGGKTAISFSANRRKGDFHGTGCLLSSAITVFIAGGYPVEKAVEKAKAFVDKMLKTAKPVGRNRKALYFQF